MIASVAAPTPPHHPTASRPSRLRGLSLLRRSGQKSNPNSPPVSPPERSTLERSTSYPLNVTSISAASSNEAAAISSTDPTRLTASGSLPDGSTTTATISSSTSSTQNPASSTTNLAPEHSGGMARLRRAFSSQNGSQPSQSTSSSTPVAPAPPSAASATSPPTADSAGKTGSDINGNANGRDGLAPDQMPTIKFIPHQDPRSSKPSLAFAATSRTLPHEDCVIRVGRYSERDGPQNPPPGLPSAAPVGFKSKVVSRKHCEFWCSQGQWYIKDIKSSSGTFLNHIRLSQPNMESKPFPINDGDVVQLGIDFKGGEEAIFRCVKIRIECNRNWQKKLNDFNMSTHKRLRELNKTVTKDNAGQTNECSICLMSIAPCQSLFVAPCSHVWHFKCIRPMLTDHKTYPQFLCPNCRAVTDLEADIEEIEWNQEIDEQQDTDPEGVATGSTDEAPAADDKDSNGDAAEIPSLQADGSAGLIARVATLEVGDTSIDGALHSQSAPMEVPAPDRDHLRPTTPGGSPVELTGHDGPLTPRNDAGPFVFDGSAGRTTSRRPIAGLAQSLEASESAETAPVVG